MKTYYVLHENKQHGPFDLEDLRFHKVRRDTMVWKEGMPNWKAAVEIPELASLFSSSPPPPPPPPPVQPEMPKNYLAEAILVTIFCFLVFGIIAIVYSVQVENRYMNGDYKGAEYSSTQARLWVRVGFFIFLGFIGLALLMGIAGALSSPGY